MNFHRASDGIDWDSVTRMPYTVRQQPGPQNALGRVKWIVLLVLVCLAVLAWMLSVYADAQRRARQLVELALSLGSAPRG